MNTDDEFNTIIGASDQNRQFKLCGKKFHLTYKTHLNLEEYLTWLEAEVGELVWYSLVNENGTSQPPLDYPHTHVAFECQKKLNRNNSRVLDYQGIHPNIKPIGTKDHAVKIWNYHGKAPVERMKSEVGPSPAGSASEVWDMACAAPTLKAAAKLLNIEPRTLMDLKLMRASVEVDCTMAPISEECCWTLKAPANWRVIFAWGETGTGKTRWALAQFKSPLLVSSMEDLKKYRPDAHDGLVFDDMSFTALDPQNAIHLTDWEAPRTLRVLYGSVTLPAQTRKIFTSNVPWSSVFPAMTEAHHAAVQRRLTVIHIMGKTFGTTRKRDMEEAGLDPEHQDSQRQRQTPSDSTESGGLLETESLGDEETLTGSLIGQEPTSEADELDVDFLLGGGGQAPEFWENMV